MTIFVLRVFVFRACGSGKLCADSKSDLLRGLSLPMSLSWSTAFAHLEGLTGPFFGASPDRFTRRIPNGLN